MNGEVSPMASHEGQQSGECARGRTSQPTNTRAPHGQNRAGTGRHARDELRVTDITSTRCRVRRSPISCLLGKLS
jgi:hypothetical protein